MKKYLDLHVTPCNQEHAADPGCWCTPSATYENPLNGAKVWVHRRTNDGPILEPEITRAALVRDLVVSVDA